MLLKPDPNSHLLDPFTEVPTLVLICDIVDPVTKQCYDRDPRYIARKAEEHLTSTGIAGLPPISELRPSFLSSTTCASISANNTAFTTLTPRRVAGIQAGKRTIWDTARVTAKATFPSRPPTTIRTCAPRWS